MVTKTKIEAMCRNAGMVPEVRSNLRGHEVFVADGFSAVPHFTFAKFGAERGDFPNGAYMTLAFSTKGDEAIDLGTPVFFEPDHDPHIPAGDKKRSRINAALKTLDADLAARKRARRGGLYFNVK